MLFGAKKSQSSESGKFACHLFVILTIRVPLNHRLESIKTPYQAINQTFLGSLYSRSSGRNLRVSRAHLSTALVLEVAEPQVGIGMVRSSSMTLRMSLWQSMWSSAMVGISFLVSVCVSAPWKNMDPLGIGVVFCSSIASPMALSRTMCSCLANQSA